MSTEGAGACAHPLAFVRAQRGWSYQRLARVVARRARDLGVANMAAERQKVWRWEHRGVVPDRVSQLALAAELGVSAEKVESHPWPAWLPTGDVVRTDYPWNSAGSVTSMIDVVEGALTDRRGFLTITGAGVASLANEWLNLEPTRLVAALDGGRVDEQVVHRIEHNIPGLRLMDDRLGGEGVRRLVDAELRVVTELLAKGSYTEKIGASLQLLAAELARIAGWASFDAGYHTSAQRYWIAALHAAHAAGDRLVGANIMKNMSLQCVDFARPKEALDLAEAAVASGGGISGRVGAMLQMRLARAHAALGDQAGCFRALAQAETAADRSSPQDPAWAGIFDEGFHAAQLGICYIDLGQLPQADRWLTHALKVHPVARARDHATYLLRRAAVQIDLGNIDHGCALVRQAVPFLEATRSQRNARRAEELRRSLRRHAAHPEVREVDQLLARPT
ncbi:MULTISPECIES: transcriptional regulator [Protofrankia]|uniref:Transcriptional regulator n=1 Tax=Protofrankia coriariae TaxID=1562887 RepID=A0ABR5F177_9ACTN|nr:MULTISPECIES: transcriptional regulator [Protofrankia]KLL10478.1 transcriptional regulator [Protofrankia coriariae]ONH33070.1 transcriptional regulator [Protofrankia sp. BMG5.30]